MATFTVSFDRMFGSTDPGGKWVVRGGMGFAPLSKHRKKSTARRRARETANIGDTIEIRNKDGSLQTRFVKE